MPASSPTPRARRSAFAAAFLSFLFPGLGHAYLRRWLRAAAWAVPPLLVLALTAGVAVSPDRNEYLAQLSDPQVLLGVLGGITVDLLYRLICLLDAYRLAQEPAVQGAGPRLGSAVGLVCIVLVLIMSHVAIARPVYVAYDFLGAVTDGGDDSPIVPLESLGPDFVLPSLSPAASVGPQIGPTEAPTATPEPIPTGKPWTGKERLNILLVGADGGREGSTSYLTDTMILVSIDPPTGQVAFISLPRDITKVPLPRSWGAYDAFGGTFPYKINTLYTWARGRPDLFPFRDDRQRGFEALKGVLSELYGVNIKYHVAVDLAGFKEAIAALGGVVIDVQVPVMDDRYPSDFGLGNFKLYIPPGMQYMNGPRALAYARSRHATSDFTRAERQQRLITSIRDQTDLAKLFEPGVIGRLLRTLRSSVKTDLPTNLLPKLISLAQEIDLDRRISLVLSPPTFGTQCYPCPGTGLYEIRPNVSAMRRAVQNVFTADRKAEKLRQAIEGEGAVVHVLNGEDGLNIKATRIGEYLATRGIDAVVPPVDGGRADRDDYQKTVITVYNGAEVDLERTLKALEEIFKVEPVLAQDPDQAADIVITVGARTRELKP